MKVSRAWLQEYIKEPLPATSELVETLSLHAFEIEGVEQVGDDEIIDIDVLPNRAHDCLSHIGIAREIALLFNLEVQLPNTEVAVDERVQTGENVELSIESPKVRRAMKRLVIDVNVGASPDWLCERLQALGQRPINNIVDITNFVTLETGQPVHAFDFDKIKSVKIQNPKSKIQRKEVSVRFAKDGEKVTTLDGNESSLTTEDLVIADSEKALDIAGIKGSVNSGIDENTTRVLLSVCNFDPATIRRTSKRLGLKTDASKRFENEITPELTSFAMGRLTTLITELAGGKVGEVLDVYPRPRNPYVVGVSTKRVNMLLGTDLSDGDVEAILKQFNFSYKKALPQHAVVQQATEHVGVPYKYGASVSYDAPKYFDCGSFVNYLYAQSGIALPRMAQDQFVYTEEIREADVQPGDLVFSSTDSHGKKEKIETLGIEQVRQTKQTVEFMPGTQLEMSVDHVGLYLGGGKVIHASGKDNGEGKVVIEDMAESTYYFKKIAGYRRILGAHKERFVVTVPPERLDLRLEADLVEEIGRIYGYNNITATIPEIRQDPAVNKELYYINKIRDILVGEGFWEVSTYTFTEKGDIEVAKPMNKEKPFLRTTLAGNIRDVLARGTQQKEMLGLEVVKVFEIGKIFSEEGEHLSLALAVAGIKQGKIEALLKEAEQKLGEALSISFSGKVTDGVFEIDLGEVLTKLPDQENYDDIAQIDVEDVQFKPISLYPFVLRDIALWVPQQVESQNVHKVIKQETGELLVNSYLFDKFEKDDRVSYAYRLVFQSHEKTLSDEEVNAIMAQVEQAVADKGWEVR